MRVHINGRENKRFAVKNKIMPVYSKYIIFGVWFFAFGIVSDNENLSSSG